MRRLPTVLKALAFLWASAATIYLLGASGYEGMNAASALTGGEAVVGHMEMSLASANGPWVVGLLFIVTLLAGLPFGVAVTYPEAHRAVTWIAGSLVLGFSIVAGFTVGFIYLPGAVVLLASAAVPALVRGDEQAQASRGAGV